MKYTVIKQCKFNLADETHSFTFVTGGDKITALDTLKDLMKTLEDLYEHLNEGSDYSGDIPYEIQVDGCFVSTAIDGKLLTKYTKEQSL